MTYLEHLKWERGTLPCDNLLKIRINLLQVDLNISTGIFSSHAML